jgi:hypothetical protein
VPGMLDDIRPHEESVSATTICTDWSLNSCVMRIQRPAPLLMRCRSIHGHGHLQCQSVVSGILQSRHALNQATWDLQRPRCLSFLCRLRWTRARCTKRRWFGRAPAWRDSRVSDSQKLCLSADRLAQQNSSHGVRASSLASHVDCAALRQASSLASRSASSALRLTKTTSSTPPTAMCARRWTSTSA